MAARGPAMKAHERIVKNNGAQIREREREREKKRERERRREREKKRKRERKKERERKKYVQLLIGQMRNKKVDFL
jgi:hypothetical protein